MSATNRSEGILLGLACGDALGRPVEFRSPTQIATEYGTLTEMEGNGTWGKPPGTVTDDTDLALCIARSVVDKGEFDASDIADRFIDWYDSGPFDIGNMTAAAIRNLKQGQSWDEAGQEVWERRPEGQNAGNGSVMRCPPLAIPYADQWEELVETSRQSSQITHADPRCKDGCAILNLTIAGYLTEAEDPLLEAIEFLESDLPNELRTALDPIASGETPATLETSGYVVHTLQTALHDALVADSAEDAIITAVNRGGDTDTIGAVAGAVAGARFGKRGLPDRWLTAIDKADELARLASQLQSLEEV